MRREQLEHLIRAAGSIAGEDDILVIGSQAILGSYTEDDLPEVVTVSIEADVAFFQDPEERKADLVDGSIGEESPFQQTFGYYAQGVSVTTAVLPEGWRDRLVPLHNANTAGVTAYCLEAHDLCVAKLAAARPKDVVFCQALVAEGLVEPEVLLDRLSATDLPPPARELAEGVVARAAAPGK